MPIELWWQDEMRLGQKNALVRQWARKGTRPRQPKDQRYQSLYLFGAICPARGTGAALALPWANTSAMAAHLREISRRVVPGAHAVLLLENTPTGARRWLDAKRGTLFGHNSIRGLLKHPRELPE